MKLGPILRISGLEEKRRGVVVAECSAFLRAGGTISLTDWDALSEDGRSCLAEAGEAAERARSRVTADEGLHAAADAVALSRERRAAAAALDDGEAEAVR